MSQELTVSSITSNPIPNAQTHTRIDINTHTDTHVRMYGTHARTRKTESETGKVKVLEYSHEKQLVSP